MGCDVNNKWLNIVFTSIRKSQFRLIFYHFAEDKESKVKLVTGNCFKTILLTGNNFKVIFHKADHRNHSLSGEQCRVNFTRLYCKI